MTQSTERKRIRRQTWMLVFVVLAVMFGLVLSACSNSGSTGSTKSAPATAQPLASMQTQTNEAGQVTVMVTWEGPSVGLVFTVAMDTHSVDLDSYDLRQLAVLRTNKGQEVRPSLWDAPKGGHHRRGVLIFPTTAADGSPLIDSNTRVIELIIHNVAGVPQRTFRWTL